MPYKDPQKYKEYQRIYREAHPQRIEENKRYRQKHANEIHQKRHVKYWENPEVARAAKRADHQKHRDERNAHLREARLKSPEVFRKYDLAKKDKPGYREANVARWETWKETHPEIAKAQKAASVLRRRARKAGATIVPVSAKDLQDLKESYCGLCAYCPNSSTCFDHVVPLARGGAHCLDNLVPACKTCNGSKGSKSLLVWLARA